MTYSELMDGKYEIINMKVRKHLLSVRLVPTKARERPQQLPLVCGLITQLNPYLVSTLKASGGDHLKRPTDIVQGSC